MVLGPHTGAPKFHFRSEILRILVPGPPLDSSPGPKNENWAKQKNIPLEIRLKMSETQKI